MGGSSPNTASVLVQGHVADVMELVFDGPVVADEFKETFGSSLVWVETGDQIDDFLAPDPSAAFVRGGRSGLDPASRDEAQLRR